MFSRACARVPDVVTWLSVAQVYKEALASPQCTAVHLTLIEGQYECDTHFPALDPSQFRLWSASEPQEDNGIRSAHACFSRTVLGLPVLHLQSLHQP